MKDIIITGLLGATIGGLIVANLYVNRDEPVAQVCAKSKINIELLNLCGQTEGCGYDQETLRKAVQSVAECEAAKAREKP